MAEMQKTQNIEEDEIGKIGTGQTLIQTVIIYEVLQYSPIWSPVSVITFNPFFNQLFLE